MLRVRDGLAVTVGIVIGAGILRNPGLIAGYLGNGWLILAVWALGGVVAALSTLVLSEMAAALPRAGGKYVYAREAFGPVAGFVAGWSELLVTRAFSGAAKAVAIAEYLVILVGSGSVRILAVGVVAGFVVVHTGGLKVGTAVQNVTTVAKVAVLAAIAAAGLAAGDGAGLAAAPSLERASWLGFALAYQSVAFAYYGWEDAAKMSEEIANPGRALPRILIGGAVLVAVLYLIVNAAYLAVLSPGEMAGAELVARDAVEGAMGSAAGTFMLVAAVLILVSSTNVNFLGMPRVAFGLARSGLAPKVFQRVSTRGTPTAGLLLAGVVILSLAATGSFESLIRFMMLVAISVDLVVLSAYFRLRRNRPELDRPMRVPGGPWTAGVTVALYVAVLGVVVGTQPGLAVGAAAILVVLAAAGWAFRRWTSRGVAVLVAAALPALAACGGGDGGAGPDPEPPRAVSISISPTSVALSEVGETAVFRAALTDQYGNPFSGAVVWSSDAPHVFSVDASGVATAVGDGEGAVRAAHQQLAATASVVVTLRPAGLEVVSGDGQRAFDSQALPQPVVVRHARPGGSPVAGVAVRFQVLSGGGTVDPVVATTGGDGLASVRWVLGAAAPLQRLAASVDGGPLVEATARSAGPPVCERTPEVGSALATATARNDCARVTADDLAALSELVLTGSWRPGADPGAHGLSRLKRGDLAGLESLASLYLAGHRLTELPPGLAEGAPNLMVLELPYNLIASLPSDAFAGLERLKVLNLGANPLSQAASRAFAGLDSLTALDLGLARLATLPDGVFDGLSALTLLSLTRNRLAALPDGAFRGLDGLQTLDLSGNRLAALPAGVFRGLIQLKRLHLGDNVLTRLPPGTFDGLSALESLDLASNRLADLPPNAFRGTEGLITLNLGGNLLDSLRTGMFLGVGKLQSLSLAPNPGSPFALTVELVRTDDQDASAPGPAQLRARVAQGAPFPTTVSLSAVGGALSSASVSVPAGALESSAVTAVDSAGSSFSVAVHPSPLPTVPCRAEAPCFQGVEVVAGPRLVLANPPSVTLSVPAVHLTQTVQDVEGSVPLVAGRRALLRVFVRSDSANAFRPAAQAAFYHNGAPVHVASLQAPGGGIPTAVNEGRLDGSFNAVVPASVVRPGLEVVMELDPNRSLPLASGSARRVPVQGRLAFDVRNVPAIELVVVPIQFAWGVNSAANAVVSEYARAMAQPDAAALRFVRALLPAPGVNATVREPYFTWADTTELGGPGLLDEIELLRHIDAANADTYYHGVFAAPRIVRQGGFWEFVGVAFQPGRSGITMTHEADGAETPAAAQIVAHEIGHNLSLGHAPCGGADFVDPDFPYADGSTGAWGYEFAGSGRAERLASPVKSRDLMSYCLPQWVSDYSFAKAFQYRLEAERLGSAPPPMRTAPPRRVLLLWGGVREGRPVLEPPIAWDAAPKLPERPGSHSLVAYDGTGRRLFALSFDPTLTSRGDQSFLFAVPIDPSWERTLATVALTGPEGTARIDAAASRRLAVLTDPATGRVRGIAREWSPGALPDGPPALGRFRVVRGLPGPP